jgi:alkylation response protein AidB-like acyl-CoA dehydrogenase
MSSVTEAPIEAAGPPARWADPLGCLRGDASGLFNVRLPGEDDPRRADVRAWIAENPQPTPKELYEAGYMVPHFPPPYGLGASPTQVLIIDEELRHAGIRRPPNWQLVRGYVGPLILQAGTPQQIDRHLRRMLMAEERWCQLFSEPEAGSDLASLTTRAERDGDAFVINGVKTWSSGAERSDFGLLVARSKASENKHRGISLLIVPMDAPGISMQPVYNTRGFAGWNMVYFDDVRIPDTNLLGTEDDGWATTRTVLANERLSMSSNEGLVWGNGPSFEELLAHAQDLHSRRPLPRHVTSRIAAGYVQAVALHVMRMQALGSVGQDKIADVVPEVRRTLIDDHGQQMIELWRDLSGPAGVWETPVPDDPTSEAFSASYHLGRAVTIGGGTAQIQRNILAERHLGMPR